MQQSNNKNTVGWIGITILLFFYPILPQYIYLTNSLNIVNFIGVMSVVLILLGGKIYIWHLPGLMVPYFLYTGICAVRYLLEVGILQMGTYTITCILVPFFIVSFLNNRYKFYKSLDLLINASFIMSLLGIFEATTKINPIQLLGNGSDVPFFHEIRYGMLRIMVTFGQPIAYGLYQVFIVAIILYRLNSAELTFKRRRFLKICYLLSILNVILTVSRIPILACVVLHMLLLYKKSKKKFINYTLLLGSIIAFMIIFCDSLGVSFPFISDLVDAFSTLFTGSDSTSSGPGIGNRLDLWSWVFLSMGNSWVWGRGILTDFSFEVYEWQTKTSIENQYLNVLFHNGIVGLVTLVVSYSSTLIFAKISDKKNGNALREEGISFNSVAFTVLILYFVCEFGVQETDMTRMYSVWIALLISYNRIIQIEDKGV